MNAKFKYLLRSGANFFSSRKCPHCGGSTLRQIDRKYIVTKLFECQTCFLRFRHPVDNKNFNEAFYQEDYVQEDGITTDLPGDDELKSMLADNFRGSAKNVGGILDLWKSLFGKTEGLKAVDYGSSWGYMSYQFRQSGVDIQSFEISKPRAVFGNTKLGLNIRSDVSQLKPGNELVYSSHVIEHVPSVSDMVSASKRLLTQEGMFVAESPNGSDAFRKSDPHGFHKGWGLVHPNYLSEKFYQKLFQSNPYFITSTPFDLNAISAWDGKSQVVHKTGGAQLLVIAKPNVTL
jgi:hypothetical protein